MAGDNTLIDNNTEEDAYDDESGVENLFENFSTKEKIEDDGEKTGSGNQEDEIPNGSDNSAKIVDDENIYDDEENNIQEKDPGNTKDGDENTFDASEGDYNTKSDEIEGDTLTNDTEEEGFNGNNEDTIAVEGPDNNDTGSGSYAEGNINTD